MKFLPRILIILASLFLLTVFLMPMWRITLIAPQYPDGITLYIWVNKISGNSPGTLQNINILNHYVGMKYIVPESIPELKYFPFVTMGLVLLGLITAMINNWKVFLGWTVVLIVVGVLGLYDFYLWEYDYGHNLSPTAPIKVPGQSYQPPLIGTKMLLNFKATSMPYGSGWFFGASIIFGVIASYFKLKTKKKDEISLNSDSDNSVPQRVLTNAGSN